MGKSKKSRSFDVMVSEIGPEMLARSLLAYSCIFCTFVTNSLEVESNSLGVSRKDSRLSRKDSRLRLCEVEK